ncbi:Protein DETOXIFICATION 34 [Linum grandiflorum]
MQHKRRKTSVFLSLHFSLRPSSFIAFLPPETLEIFSPYLNTISQYSCKTSSQPKPQPKLPKTETKRSEITTAANIANYKENGARGAGQSMAILQSEFSPLSIDDAPKTTNGNSSSYNDDEDDTAPLADLHHAPSKLVLDEGGDYPPVNSFHDAKSILVMESGKLWGIAGPIAFNILCNYGVNSFTNIFVGHIGDVELSAVAISLSVIANFSFGFLLGMGSALETLCGQAFGAGQVHLLGVYMQRSWLILLGACFFLLPLYLYATQILNLLGIEPDIAELAGRFTIQVIPQMFSLALNFPTQKFLQSQSNVGVLAWIGFATLVIHIILLYFFIYVFQWGLTGAAAAYDISAWGLALAQVVYVVGWCKEGWTGLSWLAFKDLWGFLKLSIASAVMICLEIWYFMVLIVLTGHLEDPVIAVGSLSICMNINGWEGMLFIGINAAISVRVSNELGSGHPRATKYAVIVTCAESLLIGLLSAGTILATRNDFAVIFTNSIEMRKAVADLAYLLGITMVLNSIQPVISGVAVGGGWQALVAYINLFCYYVVGLPLGFLLGYKTSLHVKGIWLGMIFGTFLQTLILICIICKTNWNKEVEQASERMKRWGAGNESVTSTSDTG